MTITACYLQEPPQCPGVGSFGSHWLNGTDRFESHLPLRVGDTVRSVTELLGVELKDARSGPLGLLHFRTVFEVAGVDAVTHEGTRLRR